jgi:hypothetical protein
MMRLRAADWFSTETCRLAITASKRDCVAPKVARLSLTVSSAVSMLSITLAIAVASAVLPMVAVVTVTAVMSALLTMFSKSTSITSSVVVLAPTWKVKLVPSAPRMFLPLNVVPPARA